MPFTLYQTPGVATTFTSSAQPNWAFFITHDAGVTVDESNNITAITDQTSSALTTTSTSGLSLISTELLNGLPTINSPTAALSAHAKFSDYVSTTNRSVLVNGLSMITLMKTTSTNGSSYFASQGYNTKAIEWRVHSTINQHNTQTGFGGISNTMTHISRTGWEFRYISYYTADRVETGTAKNKVIQYTPSLPAPTTANFTTACPLIIFNRHSSTTGTVPSLSAAGSMACFGICDPSQVEQARNWLANKYSLTL